MNALGNMYLNGKGVDQDYSEALIWYEKAAEKGYGSAMCNIGQLYRQGFGVPVDKVKAEEWYRKAIIAGHDHAKEELELMGIN
jgi:TPR repeat protein